MKKVSLLLTTVLLSGLLSGCITVYEAPGKTGEKSAQSSESPAAGATHESGHCSCQT